MAVRKGVSKPVIRRYWTEEVARSFGFSSDIVFRILDDDSDDCRCWCCGKPGYQEICHIVPHSLDGGSVPANLFLMCSECHMASPDTSEPALFVRWVNENSNRFYGVVEQILSHMKNSLTVAAEGAGSEEAALRLMDSISSGFDAELERTRHRVTTHGSYTSISTMAGVFTMAIDSLIGRFSECERLQAESPNTPLQIPLFAGIYNESAAAASHAPWRHI